MITTNMIRDFEDEAIILFRSPTKSRAKFCYYEVEKRGRVLSNKKSILKKIYWDRIRRLNSSLESKNK